MALLLTFKIKITSVKEHSMKVKAAVIFDQGLPRPYEESQAVKIEQVVLSGPKETEVMDN